MKLNRATMTRVLVLMTTVILSIYKETELKQNTDFFLRIIADRVNLIIAIINGVLSHATSAVMKMMLQRVIVAGAKKN
jgi:hypothetical protein